MGYFNYFIKCLIRNFVNTLFRPRKLRKILVFFLISAVVFLLFTTKSRAVEINDYTYTVNPMYLFYNHENNPSSTFTYRCYPLSKGHSYYFSGISSTYSLYFTSNADFIQTLKYSIEGTKSYYGYLEDGSNFIMVNNVNLGASTTTNYYELQGFNIALNSDFTYTAPDDGYIYCLSSQNFTLKCNYDVTYSSLMSIHTAIDSLNLTISEEFTKLANSIKELQSALLGGDDVYVDAPSNFEYTADRRSRYFTLDNLIPGKQYTLKFTYNFNPVSNFRYSVNENPIYPTGSIIDVVDGQSFTYKFVSTSETMYLNFIYFIRIQEFFYSDAGIDNINSSVIEQGEQTRDTITNSNVDDISSDNLPSRIRYIGSD